jgi:hypothetical protein
VEHVVLLGDSIFDNKVYVGEAPDVVSHLRNILPRDWKATLCAVDGSTISGIKAQVNKVPKDASCLFVSVGGNDALMNINLLSDTTLHGSLLLTKLARIAEGFRADYMKAIEHVCRLKKPTVLCTIYNGNMAKDIAAPVKAAVAVFNDKIYSLANEKNLAVIDLRRICNRPEDYANPIEPSDVGGKKIASAILEHVKTRNRCVKSIEKQ